MSEYTISISEPLYEKAQQLAKQNEQSVDQVIQEGLELALNKPLLSLPEDEQAELQALHYLSDDTLWTIARERMGAPLQARLSELMTKNSNGTLASDEEEELKQLVDRGERLTLRKARAMKLLMTRGHSVSLDDIDPIND